MADKGLIWRFHAWEMQPQAALFDICRFLAELMACRTVSRYCAAWPGWAAGRGGQLPGQGLGAVQADDLVLLALPGVQQFIAETRSLSDVWAASEMLPAGALCQ